MNLGVGNEAEQFHCCEYLFRIFGLSVFAVQEKKVTKHSVFADLHATALVPHVQTVLQVCTLWEAPVLLDRITG
jgi:hypothetical protein